MFPPAPGRLSMTTVWPSCARRFSAITRAVTSVLPPGEYGTTSLIGREGQVSANAGNAACSNSNAPPIALIVLFIIVASPLIGSFLQHINQPPECLGSVDIQHMSARLFRLAFRSINYAQPAAARQESIDLFSS